MLKTRLMEEFMCVTHKHSEYVVQDTYTEKAASLNGS